MMQSAAKRDKATGSYSYNGWTIVPMGGHITMRRFSAKKGGQFVWAFRLKEVLALCDTLDTGRAVDDLYLKPLYL